MAVSLPRQSETNSKHCLDRIGFIDLSSKLKIRALKDSHNCIEISSGFDSSKSLEVTSFVIQTPTINEKNAWLLAFKSRQSRIQR